MADTLLQFAQDEMDRYTELVSSVRQEFASATGAVTAAAAARAVEASDAAEIEEAVADNRAALADPDNMPADIENLAEELRELLVEQRAAAASLLAADADLASARRDKARLEQLLADCKRTLQDVEAALASAQAAEEDHTEWKSADTADDLNAVAAGAQDQIDGAAEAPDLGNARTRVEADIPEALRTRARERVAALQAEDAVTSALLTATEDVLADHLEAAGGADGLVEKRWLAYSRAESAFRDVVFGNAGKLSQALAALAAINRSTALTGPEQDRIAEVALDAADDALVNAAAVDSLAIAIAAKRIELEQAVAQAHLADVDAEPADDPDVQTLQAELAGLEADLDTAEAAFTADQREALDLWEAAVPDWIWSNLAAFDRAERLLSEIAAVDPATLAADMDAAESALVAALEAEDKASRTSDFFELAIAELSGDRAYLTGSADRRLLSALRGDA